MMMPIGSVLCVCSVLLGNSQLLDPRLFLQARKHVQAGFSSVCPNDHPRADVDLPSPLPTGLRQSLKGIESLLESMVDPSFPALSGKAQSAGVQVDYRGEKLMNAFVGERDAKTQSGPPDETTIFRIGSCSKLFPVLMLYQLYDRGVVSSLDDPLSKYAPNFYLPNVFSRSNRKYTLRQLASQLSGMPRELPCNFVDCNISTQEIISRMSKTPGAQFAEYTEPSYSNAAYSLLGNVLAEHVNMTFANYVQKNILDPLGMNSTGVVFTKHIENKMAKSYVNETAIQNVDIGYNAPAGQMYSNIQDMMRLGRYFLGISGELFDDGLRKEILMPGFLWRDGGFLQGSPWEAQFLNGSWLMLGKGGNIMGFSAVIGMIPQLNLSIAALWTGVLDETSFIRNVYELILPHFIPTLASQRPPPSMPNDPARYIGIYEAVVSWISSEPLLFQIKLGELPQGGQGLEARQMGSNLGWLHFHTNGTAFVDSNGGDYPRRCFAEMANANDHLWVTFEVGANNSIVALEMPGSLYGVKFVRKHVQNDGSAVVI